MDQANLIEVKEKKVKFSWLLGIFFIQILLGITTALLPKLLPLIILAIAIFALFIFKPKLALIIITIAITLEAPLLKYLPREPFLALKYGPEAMIYILFLFSLLRNAFNKKPLFGSTPINKGLLLFLLAAILASVINAVNPFIAIFGIRQVIRYIFLYFLVVSLSPDRNFIRKFVIFLLALALLESLLAIGQASLGGRANEILAPAYTYEGISFEIRGLQARTRLTQNIREGFFVFATLGRYNIFGIYLSFFFLLVVAFLYEKYLNKYISIPLLLIMGYAILLTGSRLTWLGIIAGLAIISLKKRDIKIVVCFIGGIIIVLSYLIITNIEIKELHVSIRSKEASIATRFLEIFSSSEWQRKTEYEWSRLIFLKKATLEIFPENPFGVGSGMLGGEVAIQFDSPLFEKYDFKVKKHLHNSWLAILTEIGIMGLFSFVIMFYCLYKTGSQLFTKGDHSLARSFGLGFCAIVTAFAVQSFLTISFEMRPPSFYFWMIAALATVLNENYIKNRIK